MEKKVTPRPVVGNMTPLIPELSDLTPDELCERLGRKSIHKLSFNESPYGPSPKAVKAIQDAACRVNVYSDMEGKELRRKIAEKHGQKMENVFISNGGDEAINLLVGAFVSPRDEVLMPWPTFGQYAAATTLMDGVAVKIPVRQADQKVDFDAMLAAITQRTKAIFLCNPNNPTSVAAKRDELRRFIAATPPHVLVCIDEAYAEYATDLDYASGIGLLSDFSHVAVIRTFSKIYGLAGIRVGYGIAGAAIVEQVQRVRAPFNVNSLAQSGALAALNDTEFIHGVRRNNATQRRWLSEQLEKLGWRVFPSQTNFLFVDTGCDASAITASARSEGFVFRAGAWEGYPTFLRISLGSAEQNAALVEIFRKHEPR